MRKINFGNDNATNQWCDSLKKSTRASYGTAWRYFLEYTGLTGDQILESRKADKDYSWEKKLLPFKRWMIEEKHKSENTAKTAAAAVRGFFSFHRVPLKPTRTESKQLTEAKRKTEDYRFSREDLKKMADFSDLEEEYVITAGKSFGLRAGDFLRLTRGDLQPYIDRPVPISIGEYSTQKESVKAYPFIDSDAQPVVKRMLETMDREGRIDPNERMLTYKNEIELTRVLKRVADKAGIPHGNKIVRFHCLRKFLIDNLSRFMSSEKWKQIVGKAISESAYVSPDSLREDYTRAMAETTFMKTVAEADIELIAKKQALMMLAKLQGMNENEMRTIFRSRKAETTLEQIGILEELTEQKTQANSDCPNGQRCQRVVSEEQLEPLLAEGWRVVCALPSGKIVLER